MKHIDKDNIYKFELDLLDQNERIDLINHIQKCKICHEKLNNIKKEISLISSFDPSIKKADNPLKINKTKTLSFYKRAAIIIVGFLVSYTAVENIFSPKKIVVSGQKLIPKNPEMDSLEFYKSQNVDLYNDF